MIPVFLDANELSRPTTRTLLLAGAAPCGVVPMWSAHVEVEADQAVARRNQREQKTIMLPSVVRQRYMTEFVLSAPGQNSERFTRTRGADRQVLADARAAGARFLITEDVDDFDGDDLDTAGVSAVTADLFMSRQWSEDAYRKGVELLAATAGSSPERIHQALGRLHPHLTTAFRDLYPSVAPDAPTHPVPAVEHRGRHRLAPGSR